MIIARFFIQIGSVVVGGMLITILIGRLVHGPVKDDE